MRKNESICVIGLGYVGLPLALALAKHYPVTGADSDINRLHQLRQGIDRTGEVAAMRLAATPLRYVETTREAADCSVYIVTAPTPVHADCRPNWSLLEKATRDVAAVLKKDDMVVFESTVCPGSTDNLCVPILEQGAGLRVNRDFDCAYSPERISPNEKGVADAVKIISASNAKALERVATIYGKIIPAGLHRAASISIAEAAKLAENIQRDVDIAITNELAMIFDQFGIDSDAVFAAAATKWNYRRFKPGLVGGHCIGTDSYYLLERTEKEGIPAPLLHSARRVNNAVPKYVAERITALLQQQNLSPAEQPLLLMGYSFKENCTDVRNTLAELLRRQFIKKGFPLTVCDPIADADAARRLYGVHLQTDIEAVLAKKPRVVVFAVAHDCFRTLTANTLADMFVADIKGIAARADWRL